MKEIEEREHEDAYRKQELDAMLMGAARYPEDVGVVHSTFRDPVDSASWMLCISHLR